jgi:hypothetical protein
MSHSTSRPYGKWYDSRVMFFLWRWSEDDLAELAVEKMDDEQERLRAADMMAKRFVDEFWPEIEVAVLPPRSGFESWNIIKHRYERREEMVTMLQQFWRARA